MGLMSLNLARSNARGLRIPRKCVRVLGGLSNLRLRVAAVQETRFICNADCRVLEKDFASWTQP